MLFVTRKVVEVVAICSEPPLSLPISYISNILSALQQLRVALRLIQQGCELGISLSFVPRERATNASDPKKRIIHFPESVSPPNFT